MGRFYSDGRAWRALLPLGVALGCQSAEPSARGGGGATSGGTSAVAGAGSGAAALDPGRKAMHRLNTTEYNATVRDVLGTKLQPANGNWRIDELGGLDNQADGLGIDDIQFERYLKAAQALAAELMASDSRERFVKCSLTEAGCASQSIEAAGLRIFRRPLEQDEVATYQRVFDASRAQGDDTEAAFTTTLVALLSSAQFLYRIELDPDPNSTAVHALDAYELASRLSYFLWSSAPDEGLLAAAADGSLARPEILSAQVARLLGDARTERFVESFAGQWLGARLVPSHPAAPQFYQWEPRVAQAAGQEMLLYFSEFLKRDRSWFEFPLADVNYIDGALATLYGMPTNVSGYGTYERVEHATDERAGFFGLAGFLALTSFDRRTSPSKRGRWVLGNLLCQEPPPPMVIPTLPADQMAGDQAIEVGIRAQLEEHRARPECAACHALFDPYGLALEQFDAVGVYRTSYADGSPIDASTTLPASEGSTPFTGLQGLAELVSKDPRFGSCLAQKLFSYGLGRSISLTDRPHLEQMQREWLSVDQVPSVNRLIQALVATEAFRSRRGGT